MKKLMIMAVLGLFGVAVMAQEAPKETTKMATRELGDWATITFPESAEMGQDIEIKIKLKNAPIPNMLKVEFHKQIKGEWKGYADSIGMKKVEDPNQEFVFKTKIPRVQDMNKALFVVYLTSDGTWEKLHPTARSLNAFGIDITAK